MFEILQTKMKRKNRDNKRKHDKYYLYKKSALSNNKQIQETIKKLISKNVIVNHRDRENFKIAINDIATIKNVKTHKNQTKYFQKLRKIFQIQRIKQMLFVIIVKKHYKSKY